MGIFGAGCCYLAARARLELWLASGLLLALAGPLACAQADTVGYPDRPVRIIVNVPPGGGVDTATRIVAEHLGERLRQPFVVENRASESGNLGAEIVFHAEPNGYVLLSSSGSPLAINNWIFKHLDYDPAGFEPISIISRIPNVLVVRNDFPARTPQEFISYVKANPGRVTYASQGTGTASHLTAELFMTRTGTNMIHVPYKGTGPALSDLMGGHVDCSFIVLSASYEFAQTGKVRILSVLTDTRVEVLPDVRTMVETGYPDLVSATWNALSAPPRTPAPILEKLNATINDILKVPAVGERFRGLQLYIVGGGLAQTKATIEKERRQWGEVVHATGIEPE